MPAVLSRSAHAAAPMPPPPDPTDLAARLAAQTPFLRRLARALVRDEHAAEDLVQDAVVAALEHPPAQLDGLRAWLARSLRRRAIDRARSAARRAAREERSARPEAQLPGPSALERLEGERVLLEELSALDEPYRSALYQRFRDGLTPRAIAAQSGVPEKTVKTRLARGLERLRARLEARYGGRDGGRAAWLSALAPLVHAPRVAEGAGLALGKGILLGGWLVKKLVVGACLALVLAAGVWFAVRSADGSTVFPSNMGAPDAALPALADAPARADAAPPPAREERPTEPARVAVPAPSEATSERGALRVYLRWPDGAPAAGVALRVHASGAPEAREEWRWCPSDAEGVVLVEDVPAGAIEVQPDRQPERTELEVKAGETTEATLELTAGTSVRGRVVDAEGRAVPGATLYGGKVSWGWPDSFRLATCDAGGRFLVPGLGSEGLRSSDVQLAATAPGYAPSLAFEVGTMPEVEPGVREVELVLGQAGARFRGRVIERGGEPIAGARVFAGERGGYVVDQADGTRGEAAEPILVLTDAEGRFEVPTGLRASFVPVVVVASGFAVWHEPMDFSGGDVEREITLVRGARLEGRLVDVEGRPVAGGTVLVGEETGDGWYRHLFPPASTTSDADGGFALELVAPGPIELHGRPPREQDRLGKAVQHLFVRGDLPEITLTLDPSPTIEGRVVDENGEPLVDWTVDSNTEPYNIEYPRQDRTDADGRFVLVNTGSYPRTLKVRRPHEWTDPPMLEKAGVAPGTHGLELRILPREAPSAYLRGRFLDGDGRAPKDAQLLVRRGDDSNAYYVEFDAESGGFRHGPLLPGSYRLQALRGGRWLASTAVLELRAHDELDVGEFRLGALGSLEVTLEGVDPAWMRNLFVSVEHTDLGQVGLEREGERLVAGGLAAGTWRLSGAGEGALVPERELVIRAGEVTRVALEAREGRMQNVRVLGLDDPDVEWRRMRCSVWTLEGERLAPGYWAERAYAQQNPEWGLVATVPLGASELRIVTDTGLERRLRVDALPPPEPLPALEAELR